MKRGLRQGRPLYVILYAVFAEIFLEHIRQNNFIKGIVIGEKELKTSVFADDTTIYIGSNSSLTHFETQLMHFEKANDIKYNKTVCMGIWLGPNKDNQRKHLGSKLNSDTIKILGYTYRHNTIRTGEENWEKICKKNPRGYTELGTFTTLTHRKENINKSGQAMEYLVPIVSGKPTNGYYPKHKKTHTRLPLEL